MAFGHRTYLDGVAVWRRWKMYPIWAPSGYGRFVPRKVRVRRLNKFLGVFHFPWNSGFARLCGLRDVHVLPELASRGAVYHTRKSAGEWKHFHRGRDCKVVPSFERDPYAEVVEGVKPREL